MMNVNKSSFTVDLQGREGGVCWREEEEVRKRRPPASSSIQFGEVAEKMHEVL